MFRAGHPATEHRGYGNRRTPGPSLTPPIWGARPTARKPDYLLLYALGGSRERRPIYRVRGNGSLKYVDGTDSPVEGRKVLGEPKEAELQFIFAGLARREHREAINRVSEATLERKCVGIHHGPVVPLVVRRIDHLRDRAKVDVLEF